MGIQTARSSCPESTDCRNSWTQCSIFPRKPAIFIISCAKMWTLYPLASSTLKYFSVLFHISFSKSFRSQTRKPSLSSSSLKASASLSENLLRFFAVWTPAKARSSLFSACRIPRWVPPFRFWFCSPRARVLRSCSQTFYFTVIYFQVNYLRVLFYNSQTVLAILSPTFPC